MTTDTAVLVSRLRHGMFEAFRNLPTEPADHSDTLRAVRNAHFYVQPWLDEYLHTIRSRFLARKEEFVPLPWYRQKAVCERVANEVRDRIALVWLDPAARISEDDADKVWDWIHDQVDEVVFDEYRAFYNRVLANGCQHLLHRRTHR